MSQDTRIPASSALPASRFDVSSDRGTFPQFPLVNTSSPTHTRLAISKPTLSSEKNYKASEMTDEVPPTRKRARGKYASLICFRCRERRIKCQLADDGSVIPSGDPQPPDKACQRCRQHGYDCVVRRTTLGRPNLKKAKILTPSSTTTTTGHSASAERDSRSPSPDADDLVLLTLDEERSPVAEKENVGGQSPPNGANMYGAVNRTFDLTSSLLGRDKVGYGIYESDVFHSYV